jgi:hypothetical protein
LDHQLLEAVLAVDMEALEQFGVLEGIEADGTGQLVLQLLEGLLGYSLLFMGFGHHDKLIKIARNSLNRVERFEDLLVLCDLE